MRNFKRFVVYILGLFIMAFGVAMCIKGGLGITPMTSVAYIFHMISGLSLSISMTIIFAVYVILQVLILGSKFSLMPVIQIIMSFVFGTFTDLSLYLMSGIGINSLFTSLIFTVLGSVVLGLGASFYIQTELALLPADGLVFAVFKKSKKLKFGQAKNLVDLICFLASTIVSILYFGRILGVGVGTFISAILVGQSINLSDKFTSPLLKRLGITS